MNESDKVRVKRDRPRGILNVRPEQATRAVSRYWPSDDLAPFVEHFWIVRWDVREPRVAETVPHPSVHMVLESNGRSEIVGVMRTRFSRVLDGRGRVVGTKFHPGGFRPFVTPPVSALTGRRVPVLEVFGERARCLGDAAKDPDELRVVAVVEAFLRACRPVADEPMILARRVAARVADDRSITRVEPLAGEFHTTVRQLQRLFSEYVGLSPKGVIQRYRLLDAAERVASGTSLAWPALALDLGYADQAHFIRDFKRLIGRSPAEYARHLPPTIHTFARREDEHE